MGEHTADPICGNCDKPLSAHYEESDHGTIRLFCYMHTNGDWFQDQPHDDALARMLEAELPDVYEQLVHLWRVRNGHEEVSDV